MSEGDFAKDLKYLQMLIPDLSEGPWFYDHGNWDVEGPRPERKVIACLNPPGDINHNSVDGEFMALCRKLVPEILKRAKKRD
jgi:hypothetical protein